MTRKWYESATQFPIKQLKQAENGLNTAYNAVIVVPSYPNCCTPLINVIGSSPTAHSGRAYSIQTGREQIGTIYIL